jgi:hypothetical protein
MDDCGRWSSGPPSRPAEPLGVVLVFLPARPRSWILIAPDESFALATLREIVRGPAETTLSASRSELAPLSEPAAVGLVLSAELLRSQALVDVPRARRHLAFSLARDGNSSVVLRGRLPREALTPRYSD